ncbi:hypothetical protein [Rhodophyticola porphyridii]
METRRWMTSVLAESRKDLIRMPWERQVRAGKRAETGELLDKAS